MKFLRTTERKFRKVVWRSEWVRQWVSDKASYIEASLLKRIHLSFCNIAKKLCSSIVSNGHFTKGIVSHWFCCQNVKNPFLGPGAVYPNYPPSGSGYPPPPPPGYPPSGGAGAGYPPPPGGGGGGYPPPYGGGYGAGQPPQQQQQPQQMQGAGYASQLSSESTGSIPQEHIRVSKLF